MPKFPSVTALRRSQRLLESLQIEVNDCNAASEAQSEEGENTSNSVPDLPNLSFEEESEESDMDQLATEVGNLTRLLDEMKLKQQQQQQLINTLTQSQGHASGNQNSTQQRSATALETLFKIPDPIKSIPKFDGNRKQLISWLTTAENTLNVFKDLVSDGQYDIFVTAVINKIEGKAKDIICLAGNPQNFEEVKEILTNALGDRQELTYYKSQLWQTKMTDNMSVHKYYNRCKEICQNIKSLAKQKQKYKDHWDAINAFIEEDALAAFLAGLKEPYFGYAQAARPDDMEAAYAFVCKFKCKETTASTLDVSTKRFRGDYKSHDKNYKKPQFDKPKPEKTEPLIDAPQPAETGSSKSKLTLNRRQVNNNEISDSEENSEYESESDTENVDINFCSVLPKPNLT